MRSQLFGLAVALALADSSIVTLALPDIRTQFDVGITTVAWVLTSFNLVLALVAVPAAYAARRRPRRAFAAGTFVFVASSLACGFATSFAMLVAARSVQAIGAALVATAALGLLSATSREGRAVHIWVTAGVIGAALGPAVGGILTQLVGWEAIFFVQVPIALLPLAALRTAVVVPQAHGAGLPRITPNVALLLLSGSLVAALFLIVLLLVEGWGTPPAAAGLVVTVMPSAAAVTAWRTPSSSPIGIRIASGAVLIAGGLAALALLPHAGWVWTIPPQVLIGVGIGLALAALTERAVGGAAEQVVHGGWTLAARHAGVVLGLLLLAPILATALERNKEAAVRAGAAEVLDSRIPPLDKLGLAQDILGEIDRAKREGTLPKIGAAFRDRPSTDEYRTLRSGLQDELDRAVTNAFSRPFLLATALALAALLPLALGRWERS